MSLTLTTAASGVARVAHYVVPTGQTQPIPTLLLEAQRTNLALRSEEFNDATWTKAAASITANSIAAPDGTLTADRVIENTLFDSHGLLQSVTKAASAITYTFSVFVKGGLNRNVRIELDGGSGANRASTTIDLTNGTASVPGTVGTFTAASAEIVSLGNSWYRCALTVTTGTETTIRAIVWALSGTTQAYTGDGASGLYLWGAQLEVGASSSSYIKTEGMAVTRSADLLYFPFTALPQAMTVYVRGVERGVVNTGSVDFVFGIGLNSGARIQMRKASSVVDTLYHNGATSVNSGSVSSTATLNALREFRATVTAAGVLQSFVSNNNAAEASSTVSSALALTGSFSAQRIYLNSAESANTGMFAFTNVVVAAGEQSRDTMRQLAGVV